MSIRLRHAIVATVPLLLSACMFMAPPAELNVSLARPTDHNTYRVAMRPLAPQIDVNKIHPWEIRVTDPAGIPVTHATIAFDGGMPQHGHGLPTQPRVTAELGDGRYRLDGVKFSMTGWWEMKVQVQAAQGRDQVTFNLVLPQASTTLAAP